MDKGAFSIVFPKKKFFRYLYRRRFTLFIDSKPLKFIFSPTKSIPVLLIATVQKYVLYLKLFQYDIRYKKSRNTEITISRLPLRNEDLPPQLISNDVIDESENFQINQFSTLPFTLKTITLAATRDSLLH